MDFTNAPISVVFPVPAYPFKTNTASADSSSKKDAIACNASSCAPVGSKGNASISVLAKAVESIG